MKLDFYHQLKLFIFLKCREQFIGGYWIFEVLFIKRRFGKFVEKKILRFRFM